MWSVVAALLDIHGHVALNALNCRTRGPVRPLLKPSRSSDAWENRAIEVPWCDPAGGPDWMSIKRRTSTKNERKAATRKIPVGAPPFLRAGRHAHNQENEEQGKSGESERIGIRLLAHSFTFSPATARMRSTRFLIRADTRLVNICPFVK